MLAGSSALGTYEAQLRVPAIPALGTLVLIAIMILDCWLAAILPIVAQGEADSNYYVVLAWMGVSREHEVATRGIGGKYRQGQKRAEGLLVVRADSPSEVQTLES